MKKLILLTFAALIAVTSYSQDKKISENPAATTIGSSDIFPMVQSGANKKVPFSVFYNYFQTFDADLTAIGALSTTGFLKRTGTNTWSLDNSTYLTGALSSGRIPYYNGSALADGPTWDNTNTRFIMGSNTSALMGGIHPNLQVTGTSTPSISISRFSNNSGGSYIAMGKSRSGTLGTYNTLTNGDVIGQIDFLGADGTDMATQGAYIASVVDGTTGSNDMPGRLEFGTTPDGSSTTLTRFIIDNAGKFKIGATPTNSQSVLTLLSRDASASGEMKTFTLSSYAATLLDDSNQSQARTTLGLAIGTDVQAYDAELAALASTTSAADKVPYYTGSGTASTTTVSSFARTVLDDANGAAMMTTMGLGYIKASAVYDFPLIAVNSSAAFTMTVAGAELGDQVMVAASTVGSAIGNGVVLQAVASSSNQVIVWATYVGTGGGGVDIASRTYSVLVLKM